VLKAPLNSKQAATAGMADHGTNISKVQHSTSKEALRGSRPHLMESSHQKPTQSI